MKIGYLIGNGFDINLGLKTKYSEFYEYYVTHKNPEEENQDEIIKLKHHIIDFLENNSQLSKERTKVNWADLELALGAYSKYIQDVDKFTSIYIDINNALTEYIKNQDKSFKNSEEIRAKLTFDLAHPYEYLTPKDSTSIQNFIHSFGGADQWKIDIISFNYTLLFEKIFNYENTDLELGKNKYNYPVTLNSINHIHGTYNNTVLLGVNDRNQIDNDEFKDNLLIQDILIKPRSNAELGTLNEESCKKILSNCTILCIFGLSLGDTDKLWWDFIMNQLNTRNNLRIILFVKGKELKGAQKLLIGAKEREYKNLLMSKTSLSKDQQDKVFDKIFFSYNSDIFNCMKQEK